MKAKYTKEQFEKAVKDSRTIRQVLIKLNIKPMGGNYKVFHNNIKKFGIDISHLSKPNNYGKVTNKIKQITDSQIIESVKHNISYHSVLKSLSISIGGSSNRWIRSKIAELNLDISHFLGSGYLKGKTHNWNYITPLEELLKEDVYISATHRFKLRLIKENILIDECSICGIDKWRGQHLSLHIDHINGNNRDYRIENLRLLCPNCHSLTETYCRKKK